MAGLAAADRLLGRRVAVEIFEAKPHWGGHTHSLEREGFIFDEGPHVSFTKDDEVRALFARGAGEVAEFSARIDNWFHGHWVPHPAQCHLYGLPEELVVRCIADFVEARSSRREVETYADWCVAMFGKTFAETFPFRYTRKYWTREASSLTTDWVGERIYPPELEDVLRGALTPRPKGDFHYLSSVRYPRRGGFQSFMKGFHHPELLKLGKKLVAWHPGQRTLRFEDGTTSTFDRLLSTMPLPELVLAAESDVPEDVRDAARRLHCTSVVLVDVAVTRSDLCESHWFYVYDEDISFSRVHFPHMFSAETVPPGRGAIQVEIYHSEFRPLPCDGEELVRRVIDELCRLGVLEGANDVLWTRRRDVPFANVIFDRERSPALATILPWIRRVGVELAGRYAEWAYYWTDDAVKSGWAAADRLLELP